MSSNVTPPFKGLGAGRPAYNDMYWSQRIYPKSHDYAMQSVLAPGDGIYQYLCKLVDVYMCAGMGPRDRQLGRRRRTTLCRVEGMVISP